MFLYQIDTGPYAFTRQGIGYKDRKAFVAADAFSPCTQVGNVDFIGFSLLDGQLFFLVHVCLRFELFCNDFTDDRINVYRFFWRYSDQVCRLLCQSRQVGVTLAVERKDGFSRTDGITQFLVEADTYHRIDSIFRARPAPMDMAISPRPRPSTALIQPASVQTAV